MFNALTSFCSVIAAIAVTANGVAVADDANPNRTMNVSLAFNGDQNHAVIWVADGTQFSELAAVADAVTKSGMAKITLSVEPKGSAPIPTHVSGAQHVGIQLSAEHAELFVGTNVPYAFIQTLSDNLRQLTNVSDVTLRSVTTTHAAAEVPPSTDPFGGPGTTSVAPKAKPTESADPFGR